MLTGHRPAWRRRRRRSQERIAALLAIPAVVGVTLGILIALQGGNSSRINPAALDGTASPSGTVAASPSGTVAASPSATVSASPSATAAAAQPAAAAAANVSCDLIVPPNALTAQGLATPWQLTGPNGNDPQGSGCNMADAGALGAFVQATIVDPATGQLSVYNPLVITQGTTAAVAPTAPTLAAGSVVNITFGFNGTTLTLINTPGTNSIADAQCNQGLPGSVFGQVGFCNSPAFYQAANQAIAAGTLTIPALGMTNMGQACPTTRSFALVDQDQSDNVTTTYLVNGNGQTAQDTAANEAQVAGFTKINNGSDNLLLDGFVDPAVGCTPFQAPDVTGGAAGVMTTSQSLDELQAAATQQTPIALVPENDPMVLNNNNMDANKTNLFRQGVDQQPVSAAQTDDTPANYCANMLNTESAFVNNQRANLLNGQSPVPAMGNNLFTFMSARLSASFTNLNCQNFGLQNPVNLTLDGNGVAIDATINVMTQTPTNPNGGAAGAGAAQQATNNNLPAAATNGPAGAPARLGQNPGQVAMQPGTARG